MCVTLEMARFILRGVLDRENALLTRRPNLDTKSQQLPYAIYHKYVHSHNTQILQILRRKYILAVLHAALVNHIKYVPRALLKLAKNKRRSINILKNGSDGRQIVTIFTLTARHGQHKMEFYMCN